MGAAAWQRRGCVQCGAPDHITGKPRGESRPAPINKTEVIMQTLQDVIDAVSVIPEKYGYSGWNNCPLTKEVMPDDVNRTVHEAARRLNCSSKHTRSFVIWWEGLCERALEQPYDCYNLSRARQSGRALRKYGYAVPDENHMVNLIRQRKSQKE